MVRRKKLTSRKLILPKVKKPIIFTRGPKVLQRALMVSEFTERPGEVPPWLVATKPEWCIYWALLKLKKEPGIDFDFQSSLSGGRLELGGAVLDFLVYDPPGIGINIQGLYWHYGFGSQRIAKDVLQRLQIEGKGIKVVFIDEDDAIANPIFYTKEALQGIDHSRFVRGL